MEKIVELTQSEVLLRKRDRKTVGVIGSSIVHSGYLSTYSSSFCSTPATVQGLKRQWQNGNYSCPQRVCSVRGRAGMGWTALGWNEPKPSLNKKENECRMMLASEKVRTEGQRSGLKVPQDATCSSVKNHEHILREGSSERNFVVRVGGPGLDSLFPLS